MTDEIEDMGYKLLYVPDVTVKHYRRPTPRKWWRQMYTYGVARVMIPRKRKRNLHLMHVLAGLSAPALIVLLALCIVLSFAVSPWFIWGLVGVLLLIAILASALSAINTKSTSVGLNMPLVLAIFFIAWSFGFMHELLFPAKPERRLS